MLKKELLRLVGFASGLITIILGIVVIIGWYTHSLAIIQINSAFPHMQYNTALCFIISGLSVIFLNTKNNKWCRLSSALLFVVPGLTLLEYIFSFNIGIDEIFFKSFASWPTFYPGRMSPSTALSFVFIGLICWLYTSPHYFINKNKFEICINLILFNLGTIIIVSCTVSITTFYGMFEWMSMAVHTTIGLLILNGGLMAIIYLNKTQDERIFLLPPFVTTIILLITVWGWQAIIKSEYDALNRILQLKISSVSTYIELSMHDRTTSFARIVYRWANRAVMPENEWRDDVSHHLTDQAGYKAIALVDSNMALRWLAPNDALAKEQALSALQETGSQLRQKAINTKTLQITNVSNLSTGKGLMLFSPIYNGNQFKGAMIGIINTKIMISNLLQNDFFHWYGIKISDNGQLLFGEDSNPKLYKKWVKKNSFQVAGETWQIELWPSDDLFDRSMDSWLPFITLIVGTLISLVAGFLVKAIQMLHIRSFQINTFRAKLSDANERLNGIIEGSSDLIAAVDLELNYISFNSTYKNEIERVFKVPIELGMNFKVLLELMSEENQYKTLALWTRALKGQSFTVIEHFHDKNFSDLDFEIHYNPIRNARGELVGASHTSTNVSSRVRNEKRMAESKLELEHMVQSLERQNKELGQLEVMMNLLQSSNTVEDMINPIAKYIKKILLSTSGVVYFFDKNHEDLLHEKVRWGNPLAHQLTLLKSDCWGLLLGKIHKVVQGEDAIICQHVRSSNEQPGFYICQPLQVQGKILGLLYIELEDKASSSPRLIYLSKILSEQIGLSLYNINLREKLHIQSTHDTLTGLYNRRFFEEYIQKELLKIERNPMTFSLVLIDIDYFKKINDNYGHLVGDKALQLVATQLSSICRKGDVICRWGGEEFLLFFPETSIANIQQKTEYIRELIENLVIDTKGAHLIHNTISIGVSVYPDDGTTFDELLAKADEALYLAKEMGRNRVVLSRDVHKPLKEL